MMRAPRHRSGRAALRAGFTLIELLVVIVIIAILTASFGVSFLSAQETARITRATAESRELGNAIRLYLMEALTTQGTNSGELEADSEGLLRGTGLREGERNDITSDTIDLLTGESGDKVYFQAAEDARSEKYGIVDPWGNPYYVTIRVIKRTNETDPEDYEIVVPIQGRHRALEPNGGSSGAAP